MTMDDEKTSNGKRMGRPPVEEPRKTYGLRMTEREFNAFQLRGGVEWLRTELQDFLPELTKDESLESKGYVMYTPAHLTAQAENIVRLFNSTNRPTPQQVSEAVNAILNDPRAVPGSNRGSINGSVEAGVKLLNNEGDNGYLSIDAVDYLIQVMGSMGLNKVNVKAQVFAKRTSSPKAIKMLARH
jgi:hypothetical protein